jgi:hypothetical protein
MALKFIEHRVADRRILRLIRKWVKAGVSEDGQWSETDKGTPQGSVATPLTQKVISNLSGWWGVGEVVSQCLTCALRGNTFMTNGTIKQSGQGSAVERRLCHAPAQYAFVECRAAFVCTVRPVGTSSLPLPGGSSTSGATCRGYRGYGADHPQGSSANCASSPGVCEKQWADHRSHRDTRIDHVFQHSEKAWLSGAQRSARFKFTLSMCLTGCTIRSSPKPTVFWYPFESVPSAAV